VIEIWARGSGTNLNIFIRLVERAATGKRLSSNDCLINLEVCLIPVRMFGEAEKLLSGYKSYSVILKKVSGVPSGGMVSNDLSWKQRLET
jgi:hypothetical protein